MMACKIKYFVARRLWREYFATGVDAVVFIVDAVDRERFPEAKKELDVSNLNYFFLYPHKKFFS